MLPAFILGRGGDPLTFRPAGHPVAQFGVAENMMTGSQLGHFDEGIRSCPQL
jgi:hypothetical protein